MLNLEERLRILDGRRDELERSVKEFEKRHGVVIGYPWSEPGNTKHYQHSSGNLLTSVRWGISGVRERLKLGEPIIDEQLVAIEQGADDLRLYLELLEQYPHYRKGEFENQWGFFPDINRTTTNYVRESQQRLTQKN